ncbi:MAG: hypothetical protein F4Y30_09600 [Chloroflexi bacterium]|nr:hypothetical protein [Chloroflexota bacterium]MYI41646.1 hypothetical protein [Chloroflexota bacterium]
MLAGYTMGMTHQATITLDPLCLIGEARDHLYGANLEHIGQAIYGGVWAEMLRDRKFAGNDRMYAGMSEGLHNAHEGAGVVVPWQVYNPCPGTIRYVHDNSVFYTGRQSQRISIRRVDGEWRGIAQGSLYLQAARDYQLRLVLRGEGQAMQVRLGDESWTIDHLPGDWTTFEHSFTAAGEDPQGQLSIAIQTGTAWVGCASLMPADNLAGFRSDVVVALRDWSPRQLRWPGGNFVSAYHWQAGIGDRDKRPSYLDPAWWQWEPNDVGTDEFIALCRLIDAEPVLTANLGDGDADEAAAWVEYCNGGVDTHFGGLRAANGHPSAHDVRLWFVGNEQFGNWQVGHCDAQTYARRYLDFARAMRAVDPNLTLIGVGAPGDLYGGWNEEVLKIAGAEMDQLSLHYYSLRTEKRQQPPPPEQIYLPKMAAAHEVTQMLDETLAVIDRHQPQLPLAFDEWNTYVGAKPPDYIEDYNLADALYTGWLMNACLQRADRIHYSAIYHLVNVMGCYLSAPLYRWEAINFSRGGGWVAVDYGDAPAAPATIKMPSTLALELLTRYRGSHSIGCQVECGSFASPAAGNMPAFDVVPLVSAAATADPGGDCIYISIVNCAVDQAMRIQLAGLDFAEAARMFLVAGESPLSTNSFAAPQTVTIEERRVRLDELALPPHSFAMLVLRLQ